MQRDIVIKGRSLGGSSDLTLLAPLKPGFVESLESVTYKTRTKRVLEALHGARQSAHEHQSARLLSDSVERVGAIHSVRVAVLEPEDKVLLAVSFDGSWESYVRVLWDKVGSLLDLVFCGTVDYVTASDHSFEEWAAWARRVQVETGFYYGPPDSTARDALYYRRIERMRERGLTGESDELRSVLPSAEEATARLLKPSPTRPLAADDPAINPPDPWRTTQERVVHGLKNLAGLYRLSDLHRPGTPDGEVLRLASIDLLLEFVQLWERDKGVEHDYIEPARRGRFARPLHWLFPDGKARTRQRPRPQDSNPLPDTIADTVLADIQGGIVRPYAKVTHGVVLLLAIDDPAAGSRLLGWLAPRVTRGNATTPPDSANPYCNVALTPAGLRALGMDEDQLALFPEDFRQGMAARAGLLGDVRNNHPRRWHLPLHVRDLQPSDQGTGPDHSGYLEVQLDGVHVVVQMRCASQAGADIAITDPAHPLRDAIAQLLDQNPGTRLLALQALLRHYRSDGTGAVQEHFGFADGNGQPAVEASPDSSADNRIALGEIVLGHANAADFAPDPDNPALPEAARARLRWLANGSFLVMRKYRQFVHLLEGAVQTTAAQMASSLGGAASDYTELVYAKLMGRARNGAPVGLGKVTNDFDYADDPQGQRCPLHAHVRLVNPRAPQGSMARAPRIMRRSMSYGALHTPGQADDGTERGLLFMAYNASISEQYEVLQRWLSGANSTGASSGTSCPIVGVPENGQVRHFRFEHQGQVFRVVLEPGTPLFDAPEVLARLEWGMYLFTPSLTVLGRLQQLAGASQGLANAACPHRPVPWQPARGRSLIAQLQQLQAHHGDAAALAGWKAAIEDPEAIDRLDSAALWAAIRADHGGVLRTPYGVLVASRELLSQVLLDPDACYSISGQFERMQHSVGEIYLGRDAGAQYALESGAINAAIGELVHAAAGQAPVYALALKAASRKLDALVAEAQQHSADIGNPRYALSVDAREVVDEVLADLCEAWFGISDGAYFRRGSADWAWHDGDPPIYPGHFTALSRYMFQPHPGPMAVELGQAYGQALRKAMFLFVSRHQNAGTRPLQQGGSPAPLAEVIFAHAATQGWSSDWIARTMVGVLMGFIAPIIGAVLNVLREWQREGHFAALRTQLAGDTHYSTALQQLALPLRQAARMRPMPQIVWRTACKAHRLGQEEGHTIDVAVGEKIVLGLVSGTQQSLGDGQDEHDLHRLMFGGARTATGPHPTHACPGHGAGMQAILGTLVALLARPETLRQDAVSWAFYFEGSSQKARALQWPEFARAPEQEAFSLGDRPADKKPPPQPVARTGSLLIAGDSWVDNPYPLVGSDLRKELRRYQYGVVGDFCQFSEWGTAEILEARKDEICAAIDKKLAGSLKAIVLSGGGNDSKGEVFKALLNDNDHQAGTSALNAAALKQHIGVLETHYKAVIDALRLRLTSQGLDVPVIVHGYDNPFPRGRFPDWFDRPFADKGWDAQTDKTKRDAALVELIAAFNGMLVTLADAPAYRAFVRYVDLRGTIAEHWNNPEDGWRDDLHPYKDAFTAMAAKLDAVIQAPWPPP